MTRRKGVPAGATAYDPDARREIALDRVSSLTERDLLAAEREHCRRRYLNFVLRAWGVLEPHTPFSSSALWYADAICEHLEALVHRQIENLLINMPGRMGKSLLSVVMLPAWTWTELPHYRFVFGSYNIALALRDSRKTRNVVLSQWYQRLWGDKFGIVEDQNQVNRFDNTEAGYRIATSVGGGAGGTGEGGHIVGVDDPHSVTQAESDLQREAAIRWWKETMSDRLNEPAKGGRLVLGHRVHAHDLSQHVIDNGGYVHLNLPMEYEGKKCYTAVKPYAVRKGTQPESADGQYCYDPRTEEGELMDPVRMSPKAVADLKRLMGSYAWPARLQQRPSLREGGMVKMNWFKRYRTLPAPSEVLQIIQSWDTANKGGQTNAFSVCETYLRTARGSFLAHVFRQRLNIPELKRTVINHATSWWTACTWEQSLGLSMLPTVVLIEEAASGISLIQQLQDPHDPSNSIMLPVIAMRPDKDKVTRMDCETPAIEAGLVWLPEEAEWLSTFETEIRDFPGSQYKDQADAMSQYLCWARQHPLELDWGMY